MVSTNSKDRHTTLGLKVLTRGAHTQWRHMGQGTLPLKPYQSESKLMPHLPNHISRVTVLACVPGLGVLFVPGKALASVNMPAKLTVHRIARASTESTQALQTM